MAIYTNKETGYKKLWNKVTSELRARVQEYYHNLIDETQNNSKTQNKDMWKTINKVLHRNSNHTVAQNIIFEGTKLKSPSQILEAFNKHFTTVGPKLAEKIEIQPSDDPLKYLGDKTGGTKFKLQPVGVGYVYRAIKALNNSKSPFADRIPVKILKDAVNLVSKPLTLMYNASLERGFFPEIWKLARVTPIHKAGTKTDVDNYRAISVLSVVSRILEKIVHNKFQVSSFKFQVSSFKFQVSFIINQSQIQFIHKILQLRYITTLKTKHKILVDDYKV